METKKTEVREEKVMRLREKFIDAIATEKPDDGTLFATLWALIGEITVIGILHKDAKEVYNNTIKSMDAMKKLLDEIVAVSTNHKS